MKAHNQLKVTAKRWLLPVLTFALFMSGCISSAPIALEAGHPRPVSDRLWSVDVGPQKAGHFRSVAVDDFGECVSLIGGSSEPGDIFSWASNKDGGWDRQQRVRLRADVRSLASGDFDSNGSIDLVSSSIGDTKGIHVWRNEKGNFEAGKPVTEKELYDGLRLVDINHDGKLDIVAANSSGTAYGGIQVWLGNGDGRFISETGPTRVGLYKDVAVGDLNKDGHPDIVGAGWGVDLGALRVWYGLGDGRWTPGPILMQGTSFWGVDIADIDGDGNMDLLAATNFNGVVVYYGDGKGKFPRNDKPVEKGSFWRVRACDLSGDGRLDLVATSNDNHGVVAWYQQSGAGQKWLAKDDGLPTSGYYFDVMCRDMSGDGKPDVVATSHGEGLKVWLRGENQSLKTCVKSPVVVAPQPVVEKEPEQVLIPVFYTAVFFDTAKVDLRPETLIVLNRLVEFLKKTKGTSVKVEGYADPRRIMTKEFPNNQVLSEGRAGSVKRYLLAQGIEAGRIQGRGFGDDIVKFPGADPDSLQKNRRVDLAVIYQGVVGDMSAEVGNEISGAMLDRMRINAGKTTEAAPAPQEMAQPLLDPFEESPVLVPAVEYKAFKEVDGLAEYRLGAGDTINVTIWEGIKENTYKVRLSSRGEVSFSYINGLNVAGLTQTELEKTFTKMLRQFVKSPVVKIELLEHTAHLVSIFGAVRDLTRQPTGPGTYRLYGKERLTQFISRVGGYLTTADLTGVELTRNRKTYKLNVYDALFRADYRQDVLIDEGDVIFIPYKTEIKNRVYVFGEVMRPGLFMYDAKISMLEALVQAGGPTSYARSDRVVVIRGDESKPEAFEVDVRALYGRGDFRQNVSLQNGDIIYVANNLGGDIRDFVKTIAPFLAIMRLPMDVYGASALPKWEGLPLKRDAAPAASTIVTPAPSFSEGGAWGGGK